MVLPIIQIKAPQSLVIKTDSITPVLIDIAGDIAIYNVSFSFNPKLAIQQNAAVVTINATTKLGNSTKTPLIIRGFNAKDVVENLLQQNNIYNQSSQRSVKYDASTSVDIRAFISKSPNFLNAPGALKTIFINENVEALNTLNKNFNILDKNLSANIASTYSPTTFNLQQQKNKLRNIQKVDPASLYQRGTNAIVPASKTYSGIIPAQNYSQVLQNLNAKNIIASQLTKTQAATQNDLNVSKFITTIRKVTTDLVTLSKTISIPLSKLGKSDFKFVIELYDINDRILQSIDKFVPHNTNISTLIPTIPPKVSARANLGIGNIGIDVQQLDPYAKGIAVYRKILRTQEQSKTSRYEKVAEFGLLAGNNPYTFRDKISTSNDIVYRFIPYNENKILSSVFTSTIQKINNNLINKKSERRVFCVMDYAFDPQALIVKAHSFPVETVAIRFYRRNISKNELKYAAITGFIRRNANGNIPVRVIDRDVQKYQIYEYKVGIMYVDGIEELAPQLLTLEYRPVEQNIATASIVNIKNMGYGSGKRDITFDIQYSIDDNQYTKLKDLLTQQNYLAEYQEQIKENREFLKTLLSYRVIRLNLATSELEDFGIITSTSFSDRKYGTARGVKPISEDTEYKYKVITYVRDPETLYPTISRQVNAGTSKKSLLSKNLTKSYTLYPYEWLQPITLRTGTTYTDQSIINTYPNTLASFEFGNVVDIQEISITILGDLPTIENARVIEIQNRGCFIQWDVKGDVNKIDHFIITLDIVGMKTIVGAAHNINAAGKFEFLDPLTNGERGQITYFITPVYYDDTQGSIAQTNTILI